MFSRCKLALETSANFVATHAGNSRWNPAPLSSASFRQVCHGHHTDGTHTDTTLHYIPRQCISSLLL